MKILVVAPRWVGDAVLSQSLLKQLRKLHPDATIDVLASPTSSSLFSFMPEANDCIKLDIPSGKLCLFRRLRTAGQIGKRKYDWAIVMTGSFKSAIVPWLAGIPRRTGTTHEFRKRLINDPKVADITKFPLSIDRASLLAMGNISELEPGFADWPKLSCKPEVTAEILQRLGISVSDKETIAFVPGSEGGDAKRWPAEYYSEAASQLVKLGFQILLIGSSKEQPIAELIQSAILSQCQNLCGKTTLGEAIHLLNSVSCVVCNDSGLMHVAAALEKPIVAIFGPTHPGHTPPLAKSAQVVYLQMPCSPCYERNCPLGHHNCMKSIEPETVISKVLHLMRQS